MIIDTHTHFYDPGRPQGVPWPPPDSSLYRAVLPDEFRSIAAPRGVAATVVVEASEWVEDNEWVLGLSADEPMIAGLVGRLDLTDQEFPARLERFARNPRFRGIRLNGRTVDDTMRTPRFAHNLSELARHGLTLDLNVGDELLDHVLSLAEATPGLTIVVDHLGGSTRADGQPDEALLAVLRTIATRPRVYCKLSGFVEAAAKHHDPVPRDHSYYRPVFDALFDAAGPGRLLWASNWPVSAVMAPYDVVVDVLEGWLATKNEADRTAVRCGNAVAAYGLESLHAKV